MNETAELFHLQSLLAGITEAAKGCRNRLSVTKSLVSIEAADVANNLAIIGQEFHNLSVRMKQASVRCAAQAAADQARKEIKTERQ